MGIIDMVRQNLGPNEIQQISQELGSDPAQTQSAIDAALPMMVGGMAGTAQQTNGASALQSAMSAFGGGGGLAGGILGSILGQHHDTVQTGVEKASGFDSHKAGKLLLLLAPFILRSLAKHHADAPAAPNTQGDGGLAGSLQEDARNAQINAGPHVGGVLGKILGALN